MSGEIMMNEWGKFKHFIFLVEKHLKGKMQTIGLRGVV